MEERGKILCKKSDNKAFKMGENWYNLNDNVIPYLEKLNKGDEVAVEYTKKGVSRYVSKLTSANVAEVEQKTEPKPSTEFVCAVCSAPLKNDKFKVCYNCNKKGLKPKLTESSVSESTVEKEWKTNYGSPKDIAGKETGCALGAAATVASGQTLDDPEIAKQYVLLLAEYFLDWMRAKK